MNPRLDYLYSGLRSFPRVALASPPPHAPPEKSFVSRHRSHTTIRHLDGVALFVFIFVNTLVP